MWACLLLTGLARADTLSWSFELAPGHVGIVEVVNRDGHRVAELLVADGSTRRQLGWMPDLDPTPGRVAGRLEQLWLAPDTYAVREIRPDGHTTRLFRPTERPPRVVMVRLPEGAPGVWAMRWSQEGGNDGFAFAPDLGGGIAFLPLGEGSWRAWAEATATGSEDVPAGATTLSFHERPRPPAREPDVSRRWMVRAALFPVTLVLLLVGAVAAWRARRGQGRRIALAGAVAAAAIALGPALPRLGSELLTESATYTDPADSVALVASIGDSLLRLSDVTRRFSYPEGATWIVTGPSWLGYLLPGLLAHLVGPVVAHNLGVVLGLVLLALLTQALARSLGAGPAAALFAGWCAVLAPVVVEELDVLSLDRTTLFLVPAFFLALHRAADRGGWRWVGAAGVALAAAFYGQVYYGLYLAVAAPLLVLPRLFGPSPWRRLGRMAGVGAVALALLAPGLVVLRAGTADTPYSGDRTALRQAADDLLEPVPVDRARTYIERYDLRLGRSKDPPMATPQERLLAAVARSYPLQVVLAPTEVLPGQAAFWGLQVLGVLLAVRRGAAIVALLDVAVLVLFAMGPFLRTATEMTHLPLPYYAAFLFLPGFEQLKQVNRFMLLAATIAPIPMALGLEGLLRRLRRRGLLVGERWAATLGCALALLLVTIRVWVMEAAPEEAGANPFYTGRPRPVALRFTWPDTAPVPMGGALAEVEPGPAAVLPLRNPTPTEVVLPTLQAGFSLVNDAPFGRVRREGLSYWAESNALLNRLAVLSGSDLLNRRLPLPADPSKDLADLREQGLRYVVLFDAFLPGPELAPRVRAFLDERFEKLADEAGVAVWELP